MIMKEVVVIQASVLIFALATASLFTTVHGWTSSPAVPCATNIRRTYIHRIVLGRKEDSLLYKTKTLSSLNSAATLASSTGGDATTSSSAAALIPSAGTVQASSFEGKPELKKQGGLFSFKTKYGLLNPFAIYYGLMSIFLGIFWFTAMTAMQFFYWATGSRFDKQRRIPIFISHVWGVLLMRLSRSYPQLVNIDVLKEFYKRKQPAMFVANHNSWMDIPFVGGAIGWRNYKLVSKKELVKVPILGKAIRIGGHVLVDRGDRRSQLETLKKGMQYLKDGVHLCTFPEGTRSKTGRLGEFKNGAFKMAHKVGTPVIPMSIVGSGTVMPSTWMFPNRPSHGVAKVIIHEPIESNDKTEEELAAAVRNAIISGLPEDQRPLE